MAGKQAPPSAVFHECIRELEQRIERFATGDSFCVRFASDDCGVAMNARLHVVILEDLVFRIVFLRLGNIVGARGNFAGRASQGVILHHALRDAVGVAPLISHR